MPSQTAIRVIVGATALIYLIGLWQLDAPARDVLFRLSGVVVVFVSGLLYIFDKYLWKLPIINRLVKRPVLVGTWKGTFESDYEYPETGEREGPTEAYIVVRQTYSTIHLRFITRRSTSESKACELRTKSDSRYEIYAVYENRPPLLAQEKSRVHRGGLVLDVVGDPAHALRGSYWTDRKTQGDLEIDKHSKNIYDDFDSARAGSFT